MESRNQIAGLDSGSFAAIAELAYRESGLQLVEEKSSMIQSRLRHRLKAVGLDSFALYADFVCSEAGRSERRQMISALTTNVSHFFRENHHFEILVNVALPLVLPKLWAGGQMRIWSAGCSNGQEPYSIVMSLLEKLPEFENLDIKVLATDIDPNVIGFAKAGVYPERLVGGIKETLLKKYFTSRQGLEGNEYVVNESVRSRVTFNELNLLANWPLRRRMDVIFCRNVVIYFDLETQNGLWPRFRDQISDEGFLFLGHSERIAHPAAMGFVSQGPTSYRPSTVVGLNR